jgi:hypothetical protein
VRTLAVLLLLVFGAPSAFADEAPLGERFLRLPLHLAHGLASGVYDVRAGRFNAVGTSIALSTAVAASVIYPEADDAWQVTTPGEWLGGADDPLSNMAYVMAGLPVVYLTVGAFGDPGSALRTESWQTAEEMGEALLLAGLTTGTLKLTTGRMRPDSSDDQSFPSMHTTLAFASAGTLLLRAPLALGIPAVALAGAVGVARVDSRAHFVSDVVAGAGIGLFFASAVHFFHRNTEEKPPAVAFAPLAGGGTLGLAASGRF